MNSLKIVHENDASIAAMLPGNPHAIGLDALTDDINSGGPDTVNSLMLYAVRQHMNT